MSESKAKLASPAISTFQLCFVEPIKVGGGIHAEEKIKTTRSLVARDTQNVNSESNGSKTRPNGERVKISLSDVFDTNFAQSSGT